MRLVLSRSRFLDVSPSENKTITKPNKTNISGRVFYCSITRPVHSSAHTTDMPGGSQAAAILDGPTRPRATLRHSRLQSFNVTMSGAAGRLPRTLCARCVLRVATAHACQYW
jgi:hypothetical protein